MNDIHRAFREKSSSSNLRSNNRAINKMTLDFVFMSMFGLLHLTKPFSAHNIMDHVGIVNILSFFIGLRRYCLYIYSHHNSHHP